MTFDEITRTNRGFGPGFDFLRLALACSVVLCHAFQLSYGPDWNAGALRPAASLIVPAFFGLSGFLVAGSMVRTKQVRTFLFFRVLRILPALAVEITMSALILGPIVTASSMQEYFTDPQFAIYFTNIIGWIHYRLPGVFLDNPIVGVVNGQLWTVPGELHCYVLLAALMLLRVATRPRVMAAIFLVGAGGETALAFMPGHVGDVRLLSSPELLVLCFLCGNVFYLWKHRIPSSWWLFAAAVGTYLGVYYFAPVLILSVGIIATTYIIAHLGMQRLPRIPLLMNGDYSYGIYLYSFSLQQAVIRALPERHEWYVNFLIATPLSFLVAAFSWHIVEKPALGLRKLLAPKVSVPPLAGGAASRG